MCVELDFRQYERQEGILLLPNETWEVLQDPVHEMEPSMDGTRTCGVFD